MGNAANKIALDVDDLLTLLPIGRRAVYDLCRQIGVRVGRGRWIISRQRLDEWLASGSGNDTLEHRLLGAAKQARRRAS